MPFAVWLVQFESRIIYTHTVLKTCFISLALKYAIRILSIRADPELCSRDTQYSPSCSCSLWPLPFPPPLLYYLSLTLFSPLKVRVRGRTHTLFQISTLAVGEF